MKLLITLIALCQIVTADELRDFLVKSSEVISEKGYHKAASMYHPSDLAKFRKELAPEVDEYMKTVDGRTLFWKLPKEQEKRNNLSDEEFLEIFIQCALQSHSQTLVDTFSNVKRGKIIGTVPEGDLIHVVLRAPTRVFEEEFESVSLITVRKIEGKYYLAVPVEVGVIGRILNPK
jgi:hypothetical protein